MRCSGNQCQSNGKIPAGACIHIPTDISEICGHHVASSLWLNDITEKVFFIAPMKEANQS